MEFKSEEELTFTQSMINTFASDLTAIDDWKKCLSLLNKYSRIRSSLDNMVASAKQRGKDLIKISKKKWSFIPRSNFDAESIETITACIERLNADMVGAIETSYSESITTCEMCGCFYSPSAKKAHEKGLEHVTKERDYYKAKCEVIEPV